MTFFIKYPHTPHLPWTMHVGSEDFCLKDCSQFDTKLVVVTEKMDGENTTIYHGGKTHARSLSPTYHPSRTYVRKLAGEIGYRIPVGYRICGENLFAKHSIFYNDLEDYFLVFNIWDTNNNCLSWQNTLDLCKELNLKTVRSFYYGLWDAKTIKNLPIDFERSEGYVVRLAESFKFENFEKSMAKFVRKNHVQTTEHWLRQALVQNQLRSG